MHGLLIPDSSKKHSSTYIAVQQLGYLLTEHDICAQQKVYDTIRSLPHVTTCFATTQQLQYLKGRGALVQNATTAKLISLHSAHKCCKKLGLPSHISDQLLHPQAAMEQQDIPAEAVAIANAVQSVAGTSAAAAASSNIPSPATSNLLAAPALNCTDPALQRHILTCLPPITFDHDDLMRPRFGLQTFPDAADQLAVVNLQLEQYFKYRTSTVNIAREDWVGMLQPTTVPSHQNGILRFLGFAYHYMGVQQPVLQHYLNLNLVMYYISFQHARGMNPDNLGTIAHDARVVSEWVWSTQLSAAQQQQWHFTYMSHQSKLQNLGMQCSRNLAPNPVRVMERLQRQQLRRESMSAAHLAVIMYSLWWKAVQRIPFKEPDDHVFVMEVLLCCLFFGFIPPQRSSVVLSLQVQGKKVHCRHPNCQHKDTCPTNHIGKDHAGHLVLHIQHHKNEKHMHHKPIQVRLPPELCVLFNAHVPSGRNMLIEEAVGLGTPEARAVKPYMFLHPVTLKPFYDAQASRLFKQLVLPAAKQQFGPQWCRTIFVEERRGLGSVECELSDEAAAAAMGHCIKVWDRAYDKLKYYRHAEEVDTHMPVWRERLLSNMGADELLQKAKQYLGSSQHQ